METRPFRLVVLVLAGVTAVGCGEASEELRGESEGSQVDTVVVEGSVFTDLHVDVDCEEYSASQALPEELSGVALTFSNPAGEVVGRASTGTLQWSALDYGCRFSAGYQVSLPASSSYRVGFEPPPPQDSRFYGAEELTSQEISLEDLEDAGFQWDFEAPPTYEVGDPPCAFDETGCLAADLVINVATDDQGLYASLSAMAGIEDNSWARDGVVAGSGLEEAMARLGDPADFPTVAPRFDLSVGPDTGVVEIVVRDVGASSGASTLIEEVELEAGQSQRVTLRAGIYILSVDIPGSQGAHFGIRVP